MNIILVCVGNFQEYIIDNIRNLILFNNKNITVITDKIFFDKLSEFDLNLVDCAELDDYKFNTNSNLSKIYRDGFWHYCSLRFFYLYSYIKKYKIQDCLHIENDTLIYHNLDINIFNKDKVCCVFDCPNRVIPCVVYIPNSKKFKVIIENYNPNLNDMENFALFDETIIERLPIFIEYDKHPLVHNITKNYSNYNFIFDGAAIGQYLGGVDPRNIQGDTRGFINETSLIKYNGFHFFWLKEDNLWRPHILIQKTLIPVFNLHIHSKNLKDFIADNPIEDKIIKRVEIENNRIISLSN